MEHAQTATNDDPRFGNLARLNGGSPNIQEEDQQGNRMREDGSKEEGFPGVASPENPSFPDGFEDGDHKTTHQSTEDEQQMRKHDEGSPESTVPSSIAPGESAESQEDTKPVDSPWGSSESVVQDQTNLPSAQSPETSNNMLFGTLGQRSEHTTNQRAKSEDADNENEGSKEEDFPGVASPENPSFPDGFGDGDHKTTHQSTEDEQQRRKHDEGSPESTEPSSIAPGESAESQEDTKPVDSPWGSSESVVQDQRDLPSAKSPETSDNMLFGTLGQRSEHTTNQRPKSEDVDNENEESVIASPDAHEERDEKTLIQKQEIEKGKGSLHPKTSVPAKTDLLPKGKTSSSTIYLILSAIVLPLLAVLIHWLYTSTLPVQTEPRPLEEVFVQELMKVQNNFPHQQPELWRRSRIHVKRHLENLQKTQLSEPVSLILTSGHGAEKTLSCLARQMAAAFSSAFNASVLNINGASKAEQDSDEVKLDIDTALREAFDGDRPAAVIHRFEELPPGSTLIFYRYCDHENAAYKNVLLVFTVLLPVEALEPGLSLNMVEEMVQEHVKEKFVLSNRSAMFNQMDLDKLSGLWSRISHLILPVTAEEQLDQKGCGDLGM